MNADATDIVRALVELSATVPHGESLLRDVRDALSRHLHSTEESLSVTLITTTGQEPQLLAAVHALLEKHYHRPIEIRERRNSSLIGGAVLQIGDQQIDLSVRGSLNNLEAKLRGSAVPS